MLACILFVFGALIVYAAILNQKLLTSEDKKQIKKKKKRSKLSEDNGMGMIEGPGNNTGEEAVLMSYHNGSSSIVLQSEMKERSSSTTSLHLNEKIEKRPPAAPAKPAFSTWNYHRSYS